MELVLKLLCPGFPLRVIRTGSKQHTHAPRVHTHTVIYWMDGERTNERTNEIVIYEGNRYKVGLYNHTFFLHPALERETEGEGGVGGGGT